MSITSSKRKIVPLRLFLHATTKRSRAISQIGKGNIFKRLSAKWRLDFLGHRWQFGGMKQVFKNTHPHTQTQRKTLHSKGGTTTQKHINLSRVGPESTRFPFPDKPESLPQLTGRWRHAVVGAHERAQLGPVMVRRHEQVALVLVGRIRLGLGRGCQTLEVELVGVTLAVHLRHNVLIVVISVAAGVGLYYFCWSVRRPCGEGEEEETRTRKVD